MRHAAHVAGIVAGLALGASGCSVLLDWGDFTGGSGDGGAGDASVTVDGEAAVDAQGNCGAAMQCAIPAPAGWTGPVELYVAPSAQGAAPACGPGFDATPIFDGNAGLTAPQAVCSACSCGAVTGVTCSGPVMSPFVDSSCGTPDPGVSSVTVTTTCQPMLTLLGVQSVTFSASSPSGGTCTTTGGTATVTALAWTSVARACSPSATPTSTGCDAGLVCTPSSASPFATSACVMQDGIAISCPAAYPSGPQVFYAGVDDPRGCSACQCSAPAGATCSSPTVDIGMPTQCSGSPIATPSGCTPFTGAQDSAKLTAAPVLVDAGSCALTGGGVPTGVATPKGATSFCCAP